MKKQFNRMRQLANQSVGSGGGAYPHTDEEGADVVPKEQAVLLLVHTDPIRATGVSEVQITQGALTVCRDVQPQHPETDKASLHDDTAAASLQLKDLWFVRSSFNIVLPSVTLLHQSDAGIHAGGNAIIGKPVLETPLKRPHADAGVQTSRSETETRGVNVLSGAYADESARVDEKEGKRNLLQLEETP
ncbi:hypothetical protein EYF80_038174 [Liparis tanakae]|uniref:Uncharacterized protein n=1 Tax=Liparis tanakae TaxID=230148 RepID=A0A4Z2GDH5_9TELE|nr:hypothetical protein EYF80_038174 [Liparis tanakae]